MGCTGDRQTIEDKMMLLKLKRLEVQFTKDKELEKLEEIDGKPIRKMKIPDYIDPEFAEEKNFPTGWENESDKDNDSDIGSDSEDENKRAKRKGKKSKTKKDSKKKEKKEKNKRKKDKKKK